MFSLLLILSKLIFFFFNLYSMYWPIRGEKLIAWVDDLNLFFYDNKKNIFVLDGLVPDLIKFLDYSKQMI